MIDQSKCPTTEQAAEELGIATGRMSQLASLGKLEVVTFGKNEVVAIASVNEVKSNPPGLA